MLSLMARPLYLTNTFQTRMMNDKTQALVIDDEPTVRNFVSEILSAENWQVEEAATAEHAFELLGDRRQWSLVFCDVMLGGADGFAVLRRFVSEQPDAKVVLMTGHGSAAGALDATAFGAYDYLLKPFGVGEVIGIAADVRRQLETRQARRLGEDERAASASDEEKSPAPYTSDIDLVGRSAAFLEVMKLVGRVAPTSLPVLLTGESGTGKEVVARAIHRRSARSDRPFVAVNCGAIPSELIESELFGHVRGAFTGADRERRGLWEEADGGTVFLDEITETTPVFQVKLLRALQEGEIRRVGSNKVIRLDVRVLAASNLDVEQEVQAGRFRKDLFYQLNAVTIHLPPLRDRREDIFPLADSFARRVWTLNRAVTFSPEALLMLEEYPWPGNIRELENAVVRAVALCGHVITPTHLPELIRNYRVMGEVETTLEERDTTRPREGWPSLAEVKGHYVGRVFRHTNGNKQAASRLLAVDRKTLERMIKRHNIPPPGGARTVCGRPVANRFCGDKQRALKSGTVNADME